MKKILIAEDNVNNFKLFCSILSNMNIEIIHAINGEEAVKLCHENSDISLILMDINMPKMNGEDAALAIKLKNPDIPIISQTAYSITGMVNESSRWCFSEFITKPINVPHLKSLIRKYCFGEK